MVKNIPAIIAIITREYSIPDFVAKLNKNKHNITALAIRRY